VRVEKSPSKLCTDLSPLQKYRLYAEYMSVTLVSDAVKLGLFCRGCVPLELAHIYFYFRPPPYLSNSFVLIFDKSVTRPLEKVPDPREYHKNNVL